MSHIDTTSGGSKHKNISINIYKIKKDTFCLLPVNKMCLFYGKINFKILKLSREIQCYLLDITSTTESQRVSSSLTHITKQYHKEKNFKLLWKHTPRQKVIY